MFIMVICYVHGVCPYWKHTFLPGEFQQFFTFICPYKQLIIMGQKCNTILCITNHRASILAFPFKITQMFFWHLNKVLDIKQLRRGEHANRGVVESANWRPALTGVFYIGLHKLAYWQRAQKFKLKVLTEDFLYWTLHLKINSRFECLSVFIQTVLM